MPKYKGTCVKCGKRRIRYREGTCTPCHNLLAAENSHEQHGIDPETPTRKMWKESARTFNKLAADGKLSLGDIAERMGTTASVLRSLMQRAKLRGKIAVVDLQRRRPDGKRFPPTAKVQSVVVADHGGGRWGKAGCKCDLCKAVRRATRAEIDAARRGSIKALRAKIDELLIEKDGQPPAKRGRGRPRKST